MHIRAHFHTSSFHTARLTCVCRCVQSPQTCDHLVPLSCPQWEWHMPFCLWPIHNSRLSILLITAFKKYPLPHICPFLPLLIDCNSSCLFVGLLKIYRHCPLPSPLPPFDKGLEKDNRGGGAGLTSPWLCCQITERRWIAAPLPNFPPMAWVTALSCLGFNVLGAGG